MALVADRDRERTAVALRRHYLEGRLSEDELDARLDAALRARTRLDLLLAARSLPGHSPLRELVAAPAREAGRVVARAAVLAALLAVWALASFALLVGFGVAVALDGPTTGELAGFPLAWLVLTWVLLRAWQRGGVTR